MLPYAAFYFFLVFAASLKVSRGVNLLFLGVFGIALLLFMGTRYWVGCDYFGYLMRFDRIDYYGDISAYALMEEPGFHLLNFLVHSLDLEYVWLIFFSSLIIVLCMIRFSLLYPRSLMVLALFFPVLVVQLGMSGLRQAIAVSLLMLSLVYFCKGNKIGTAVVILLATTFHQSAAMFLPIAFLAGRDVSAKKLLIIFLLASPLVALLLGDRLSVYQDRYIDQIYGEVSSGGALIRFVLLLIPCGMFFWKQNQLKERYSDLFPMMNLFMLITIALIPVAVMSSIALHRIMYYVMPVSILVFLYASPFVFSRRFVRVAIYAPAIIYGVYLLSWFSTSRHANICYVPYQSELMISGPEYRSNF